MEFMKYDFRYKKLDAFTLAEVLITLGIIGVVAAFTIPVLMHNVQENNYKVAYKKAFSVASQAWQRAFGDNEIEPRPSWSDVSTRVDNFNAFKSYFKIVKDCNNSNNSECWASGESWGSTTCPDAGALAFIDSSGMAWSITSTTSGAFGAAIYVDTNGFNGPNKYGYDRFPLLPVTTDGQMATAGIPVKIIPNADFPTYDSSYCRSGNTHPCYFTKWLYN